MRKMAESPFAFFRGTAHLFYRDMAELPPSEFLDASTFRARLMGDAHPGNLGAFRDGRGDFVFDINDFDEGYVGPVVWELRRMAAGLVLAAKANGLPEAIQHNVVEEFAERYLDKLADFKGNPDEKTCSLTRDNTSGYVAKLIDKSSRRNRADFLDKYTEASTGKRRFKRTKRLRALEASEHDAIIAAMPDYRSTIASDRRESTAFHEVLDTCLRLGSGIGSLGFARYYVLIGGSSPDDNRILEMKERPPAALAPTAAFGRPGNAYDDHEGKRVAVTMRAMLTNTDPLVGHATIDGAHYFVREKSPWARDFDVSKLTSKGKFETATKYIARALAGAHARSDRDYDAAIPYSVDTEITKAVRGKEKAFGHELADFALKYASTVEADHATFKTAYEAGATLF